MNPYRYVIEQPEMVLWYIVLTLVLAAWIFLSYRKMFKWIRDVKSAKPRWEFFLLPPEDLTWEIVGMFTVTAANLFLIGLFLYIVA